MKNKKTLEMVQLAVLIAITLIMAFTPLGFLRTAGLEISLLTIPVAIGAIMLGPTAGGILGMVFGLFSFYQCFTVSPVGIVLLGINPILTFLVCVPTRILVGVLTGILFRVIHKVDKTKTISYFVAGLLAAFMNTLFFMGMLIICFGNTAYIKEMVDTFGGGNVLLFIFVFVGINGFLEMPLTCIAGGGVSKALARAFRKNS